MNYNTNWVLDSGGGNLRIKSKEHIIHVIMQAGVLMVNSSFSTVIGCYRIPSERSFKGEIM